MLSECPFCGVIPTVSKHREQDEWLVLQCVNEECPVRPTVEDFSISKIESRWNARA